MKLSTGRPGLAVNNSVVFIVGPTAVGKTALSLELAAKLGAEIISCDSMQVYRGMDILSSKPSAVERQRIPHHLIDVVEPNEDFNVSQYRRLCLKAIADIRSAGRLPVFVGGTGLYMSVMVDGIFEAKTEDEQVRKRLFAEAAESGSAQLHQRLAAVDPEAASKIHANDTKRIVRALEVYEVAGQTISAMQKKRQGLEKDNRVFIFGLRMPLPALYERINRRVEEMFAAGLVEEVSALVSRPLSRTAQAAIGVPEVSGYLRGEYDLEEAKELLKQHTRQFSRRQMTWFRKDKRVQWVDAGGLSVNELCGRICGGLAAEKRPG